MTYTLPTYDLAVRARKVIPWYYGDTSTHRALVLAILDEVVLLRAAFQSALRQASPGTADLWALDESWDPELGLVPDDTLSLTERQDRAMARLHDESPVTLPAIQRLIAEYENGEVTLTWTPLTANLTVTFVSTLGIPPALPDLQVALRSYLPAWIGITYAFTYLTWGRMTATTRTWADITADSLTWADLVVTPPGSL